ncbi:TetR/AcrR family transcriptional regulator [Mycobacterium sp. DL99]|uniref:TetR/AcrR family transcriptional regulator n=1 Tax=Mycobacterium sp. DL99 TaxID=2528957 RepID=UPI002570093F|nr:TetR/AcrR family transcriptional regulator [Mycobacterium sp. DL99]
MGRVDPKHRLGPFRDPDVDGAVLAVTRKLLVEKGYRGTSMDAIAEAAGISRPTIYRRWPSKAHVVYDAVFPADAPYIEADAMSAFSEITGAMRGILRFIGEPAAREAMPGLMLDMRSDPTLQPKLAERHDVSIIAGLAGLLERNGHSLRHVDPEVLLDLIVGAAISAVCIRGVTDLDGFAASMTDILLLGILVQDTTADQHPAEVDPPGQ